MDPLNQIVKAIQRQTLHIVRQSLEIFHKIHRNLSSRGHKIKIPFLAKWDFFMSFSAYISRFISFKKKS